MNSSGFNIRNLSMKLIHLTIVRRYDAGSFTIFEQRRQFNFHCIYFPLVIMATTVLPRCGYQSVQMVFIISSLCHDK